MGPDGCAKDSEEASDGHHDHLHTPPLNRVAVALLREQVVVGVAAVLYEVEGGIPLVLAAQGFCLDIGVGFGVGISIPIEMVIICI